MTGEYNTIAVHKFIVVSMGERQKITENHVEETGNPQAQHYRKSLDSIQVSCGFDILSRAFYNRGEITGSVRVHFLFYIWGHFPACSALHSMAQLWFPEGTPTTTMWAERLDVKSFSNKSFWFFIGLYFRGWCHLSLRSALREQRLLSRTQAGNSVT